MHPAIFGSNFKDKVGANFKGGLLGQIFAIILMLVRNFFQNSTTFMYG